MIHAKPNSYSVGTLNHSQDQPEYECGDYVFAPNPAYDSYLRMHKVFVREEGSNKLEGVYQSLSGEKMPRYLVAAGWAATEAALVQTHKSAEKRLELLQGGVDCWIRALQNQININSSGPETLIEHSVPFRIALDLAVAPLFEGMILGDITKNTRKKVFEDCLAIGIANQERIKELSRTKNHEAVADHSGFAYEVNGLLAFNRQLSASWFVVPTMARSDNGYYHPEQTHDLLVIHQKRGVIKSILPVEIKAQASAKDRRRYKALLVRGMMHLSEEGKCRPRHTLEAIAATYIEQATEDERNLADLVTARFVDMVRGYYAGESLGTIATSRSVTTFRDSSVVASRHPGISVLDVA